MWKASNTEIAKSNPEALWKYWSDVENWPKQDASLKEASINGPFKVGSTISLKPKGSPKVKVTIIETTPNKSFSSVGKLPLAKLKFDHAAKSMAGGVKFTQSVTISGPFTKLYAALMGKKMTKNLKARMTKLVELLETN